VALLPQIEVIRRHLSTTAPSRGPRRAFFSSQWSEIARENSAPSRRAGADGADIQRAFVGVKVAAENFLEIKVLSTGFALLIRRPPVVRTCDIW
jgi:hypothetical protein